MKTDSKTPPKNKVLIEANRLAEASLSPISILADGSKKSAVPWKPYQKHIATPKELEVLFSRNGCGIGIVTGAVSGNLEVIDFDDSPSFHTWEQSIKDLGGTELLKSLPITETPNYGYQVFYRGSDGIESNQKLAQRKIKGERPKVLIET